MATPTTDLLLGPLTTAFTAPAACNSITVAFENPSYSPFVYPRRFASIASSCFPSGYPLGSGAFTSIFIAYGQQDQHVYYSPGICPSGWTENLAGTSGAETTAFCCQPGFRAQTSPAINPPGGISTLCTSSIESTVITTVAYTGDGEAEGTTQEFTFSGNNVPAGAIWIRYKADDFTGTATTTASPARISPSKTTGAITTKTSSSGSNASGTGEQAKQQPPLSVSPSPTSTPNADSSHSKGLSTAAKIGLGVGIPLAAFLALLIAAFIFIRNRRQRRLGAAAHEHVYESTEVENKGPAELSSGSMLERSELPGSEAGDKTKGRAELNGA